jgi:hypothetical protein
MSERNKYITEAMGECWHTRLDDRGLYAFACCADYDKPNTNFSTWEGFGKLWEWSQKQEWIGSFCSVYKLDRGHLGVFEIPDCFADAVYEYLKEREK